MNDNHAPRSSDRQTQELLILSSIAEALNSSADVEQALTRTLVLVTDLLHLGTGWVWLLDDETGQFYSAAVHNLPPFLQEPVQMTGWRCRCIQEFLKGRLTPKNIGMLECSRLQAAFHTGNEEAAGGLRFHASIPLYAGERPLGIMNVTGPKRRNLNAAELRLLSTIAFQVGIAIERARLAEARTRLARVEERERIAREIHDTLAQGLTGIALHLEGALPHLEAQPERARQRLLRALEMTRESLEEARRSVMNLRTPPLAGRPLSDALRALARTFTHDTGVRVRVEAPDRLELPLSVEAELFRIAQEALANVRSHAGAREVTIVLGAVDGKLRLTVKDDGVGFAQGVIEDGHHGILGMRERAAVIGGQLRIRGRSGRGTSVTVTAPMPDGES